MSQIEYFHDDDLHIFFTLTFIVCSCFVSMSHIHASLTLSVGYHMDFLFHEKQFCFIPYLKDFVLVNKISHLTSLYSSYGRDFQTYSIFKPIFENPTFQERLVGRSCSCMLYSENHFKLEHDWEVRLYDIYT